MSSGNRILSYQRTADLLHAYGIPLAPARLVDSTDAAVAAARTLGYPLAVKGISPELTHKSDAGLVHLNLGSRAEVEAAARSVIEAVGGRRIEGLLVQSMVSGGTEMIVGITTDPQFGSVIALGAGGVLVELIEDVVLRLPPLTSQQALAMIRETRAWRLLLGYRDRPPGDVAALARLLANVSRLATEERGRLAELDLNPVIVLPEERGVQVVDFRAVLASDIERPDRF